MNATSKSISALEKARRVLTHLDPEEQSAVLKKLASDWVLPKRVRKTPSSMRTPGRLKRYMKRHPTATISMTSDYKLVWSQNGLLTKQAE